MSELPATLAQYPELDTWIRIDPGGKITVFTGKVELGQGILAALGRVAAEELDVDPARLRVAPVDTDHGLNELYTAGSASVTDSGTALRQAAAEARAHLVGLAAASLAAPASALVVEDGVVRDPASGRAATYWELMAGRRFDQAANGEPSPKPPAGYRVVGHDGLSRADLRGIVTGETRFVQDLHDAVTLHGRVVRPPGPGARLASLDDAQARALPGVAGVVRDGSFIGVIADTEVHAVAAADLLRRSARWTQTGEPLPPSGSIAQWLLEQPAQDFLIESGTPAGPPPAAAQPPPEAVETLSATFVRQYIMHAAIGPSAARALWENGRLTVWSHTQGPYVLRQALAGVLELDVESVRVIHARGPGCYGHNGADDAALDAALLARAAPGRPVLLKWTRSDEHQWEPYGPPSVVKVQASLDDRGRIIDWRHDAWSTTHVSRPFPGGSPNLLAGRHLARPREYPPPFPMLFPEVGIHRNATPIYALPRQRVVKHFIQAMPLRTSSLRSLGAYVNVLAIESFMDELAIACKTSPVEFRLRHLEDPRARDVITAATEAAGWAGAPSARWGTGTGMAMARYENRRGYAAVIATVEVDDATAAISVRTVTVAADVGEVVDPDGVRNQLEGGVVQSVSWTLKEQVGFDRHAVTSVDWESYPILRFPEVPAVTATLLPRPGEPYLGAGEIVQGPTAAAIVNAVRDATGVSFREPPLTPARVRAALLRASS